MRIYEISNLGPVLPASGQYRTPQHDLEFQKKLKKKLKKKTKDDKKKPKGPLKKGQGRVIDINV